MGTGCQGIGWGGGIVSSVWSRAEAVGQNAVNPLPDAVNVRGASPPSPPSPGPLPCSTTEWDEGGAAGCGAAREPCPRRPQAGRRTGPRRTTLGSHFSSPVKGSTKQAESGRAREPPPLAHAAHRPRIKGAGVFHSHASPGGMLSYCARARHAVGTKAQRENGLVSGLKEQRYLSVKTETYGCQWADHQQAQIATGRSGTPRTAARLQLLDLPFRLVASPHPPPARTRARTCLWYTTQDRTNSEGALGAVLSELSSGPAAQTARAHTTRLMRDEQVYTERSTVH